MRFQSPPNWPQAPDSWIPDPGWKPDPSWPAAPAGWRFWSNDYGVAIPAPQGLFGAKVKRLRSTWLISSAAGFTALLVGIGIGGSGDSVDTHTATLSAAVPSATSTVTATVTGPAVTTTQTLPARTVTAVKTVKSVKTVASVRTVKSVRTVTAAAPLAPSGSAGDGSVYYANCSEARAAGDTPLYLGEPGYSSHLDRDGDGVACE